MVVVHVQARGAPTHSTWSLLAASASMAESIEPGACFLPWLSTTLRTGSVLLVRRGLMHPTRYLA